MVSERIRYATLDVFTKKLFAGNPLGVVFLPTSSTLSQDQKQLIAKEFNYSETIFVHPIDQETPNQQRIDIFTTRSELPFAGHPTIGAASWILYLSTASKQSDAVKVDTLITKAGLIPLSLDPAANEVGALIPHDVRIHQRRYPMEELLRLHPSLRPYMAKIASNGADFPVVSIVNGMSQIHVQLPTLEALAAVGPSVGGEFVSAADVTQGGYVDEGWGKEGLIVVYFHVRNVPDEDTGREVIRTRMWMGPEEDPATGSAASGLAAYLALQEISEGEKTEHTYNIVQGVEMGRRSDIRVRVGAEFDATARVTHVELSGSAVLVAEGEMNVR